MILELDLVFSVTDGDTIKVLDDSSVQHKVPTYRSVAGHAELSAVIAGGQASFNA